MKIDPDKIIEEIKNKKIHPIYFLYGDEPYFIDKVTDMLIQHVLTEEEKAFNQHIFYGKDTPVSTIADTARRFPMMAEHQLVVIREAQYLQETDKLIPYLESPQPSTVFVICYKQKSPDRRKKFFKLLVKKAVTMESPRLKDYRLPEWIMRRCRDKGITTDIQTATLMAEFMGSDLEKIEKEIEKLILVLPADNRKITPAVIEKYIGFSKEFNHYELTKALSVRDYPKAIRIILYFCNNQHTFPLQLTLSHLYFYFSKLLTYHSLKNDHPDVIAGKLKIHPFFINEYKQATSFYTIRRLEEVFAILRDIDLKSKGIGNLSATSCELLKELVYKIMHV